MLGLQHYQVFYASDLFLGSFPDIPDPKRVSLSFFLVVFRACPVLE